MSNAPRSKDAAEDVDDHSASHINPWRFVYRKSWKAWTDVDMNQVDFLMHAIPSAKRVLSEMLINDLNTLYYVNKEYGHIVTQSTKSLCRPN